MTRPALLAPAPLRAVPARPSRRRPVARTTAALAVVTLLGLVAGCAGTDAAGGGGAAATASATPTGEAGGTTAPAAAASSDAGAGTALAAVATLTVKGRAPMTGYTREQFGPAWADVDHNGCDTRNDVLRRDLTDVVAKDGTHGCVVLSGTLADPYSGTTIAFVRGQDTSSAVQIDHVVALADAWQKGAQQWDEAKRRTLANDPLNLLAVDGPLNNQKGAGDAATWLPPSNAFRCTYAARQVAVKSTYGLWVTAAEKDALTGILTGCPDEPLPTGSLLTGDAASVPASAAVAPEQPAAPAQAPAADVPAQPAPADVSYASCAEVRAAGAAPLHDGQPGYSRKLDRDGDGVACEG